MDEARLMMKTMLDQQRCEFREFLTQELANARGGVLVINEPIISKPVNDELIPTHTTSIQE